MLCLRCAYFFAFMLRKSLGLSLNTRASVLKKKTASLSVILILNFPIPCLFVYLVYTGVDPDTLNQARSHYVCFVSKKRIVNNMLKPPSTRYYMVNSSLHV